MSNTLEYAVILQRNLDLQAIQQATSGWMEGNAGQVQYTGGKEIKIPKLSTTGLGDYDRENGKYPQGQISLEYQTVQLTQDRAAQFYFDRHDVDETAYIIQAGTVMGEFQRANVIPEIDAYRYSKIATRAIAANQTRDYAPAKADILTNLLKDLRGIQDKTGLDLSQFVISMPYTVFEILEMSTELSRSLAVQSFTQGGIDLQVNTINGVPIIPVSSSRMKTKYVFADGETEFGFEPDPTAKDINWLITKRTAPIAVSKTDNLKIFSPDVNQDGDGWKTQYRKYHDIWILDNQVKTIYANLKA